MCLEWWRRSSPSSSLNRHNCSQMLLKWNTGGRCAVDVEEVEEQSAFHEENKSRKESEEMYQGLLQEESSPSAFVAKYLRTYAHLFFFNRGKEYDWEE